MKFALKNMSIQKKILIPSLIIIILYGLMIFVYLIPKMKADLIVEKKIKLQNIVQTTISMLKTLDLQVTAKALSKSEAQKQAIELVKNLRFGPELKDYLWINDYQPKMIMHPFVTKLNDKDLNDYKDEKGKLIFVEMANACKRNGHGFVDYEWQWKDDKTRIVSKISYVEAFQPWGWILGTGIYIEDVNEEIWKLQRIFILIFGIITLAIFTFFFYFFKITITNPLKKIMNYAEKIAEGNLQERVEFSQNNEMGKLAQALNISTEKLEQMVLNIKMSTNNLILSVNEIANGNQDLSQRTSEQASALEEVASSIEEAAASMNQNAENSMKASKLAEDSSLLAKEGGKLVENAIESIADINQSSKKIAEIISVINDIVFQTNLLALNAAVEAARAGEQGRGFAVVAGEVRNLAQRAGDSSKEISKLISDSTEKIEKGTLLVNKSGEALKKIIDSANQVQSVVNEIAISTDEQRHGLEQINKAVLEMDTMTQQNASLVEETASASEDMTNQAHELLALIEKFKISAVDNESDSNSKKDIRSTHLERIKELTQKRKSVKSTNKKAPDKKNDLDQIMADDGFEEF